MIRSDRFAQALALVGWLAICFVAAAIGAIASGQAGDFYAALIRPDWAPSARVFGPVWTLLYALMAIAAWLVWQEHRRKLAQIGVLFFLLQLVLNALWSWLFFHWNKGALALLDILLLWALIFVTLLIFWRVRPWAGVLLIPYLLWVAFACALNYAIWRLNPSVLA